MRVWIDVESSESRGGKLELGRIFTGRSCGSPRRGWQERALLVRRKGDLGRPPIAERLRRDTTMPLAWLAHWLQVGTKAPGASATSEGAALC